MRVFMVAFAGTLFGCQPPPTPMQPCEPKTCADLGATCGMQGDGCGGSIDCGTCTGTDVCGGAGDNRCGPNACTPKQCAQLNATCGLVSNGCGTTIDCGVCGQGLTCGVSEANQCGQGPDAGSAGGTAGGAVGGGSSGGVAGGATGGGSSGGVAGGGASGGSSGGSAGGAAGGSAGGSSGGMAGGRAGGSAGGSSGGTAGGSSGGSAGGSSVDAGTLCPASNSGGPSSSYAFAQWPVAVAPFQPSNYSVGTCGSGTVLDVNTRLVWQQQQSSSALTQPQAVTYCDTLVLGGESDWRLPTRVELTTIQDESRYPWPSLDTSVFTGAVGPDLWSSTQNILFSATQSYFYTVTFVGGAVSSIALASSTHFVRCVRSGPALTVTNRYTFGIDTDGTPWARDVGTALTWKRLPESGARMWPAASAACVAPWRLPSIRELHTLQDPTRATIPQINQGAFSAVSDNFWSGSVNPQPGAGAYGMGFSGSAGVFSAALGFSNKVLCVR